MIHEITLTFPKMGSKIFCAQEHGVYILEHGPGAWRAMANTHMGNGSIAVYDGLPDQNGSMYKAKKLFSACPPILGMWMFDAGFDEALTLVLEGMSSNAGLSPCVSIAWVPFKEVKRNIKEV